MPRILKTLETIALKFTGGTPASGKVITGDGTGNASWNYVSNTNVASNAGIAVSKLEAASPNQVLKGGATGTPEFGHLAIDVPIGTVIPYMFPNSPVGFLVCDGSTVLRSAYPELFQLANSAGLVGTVFGAGDGSTTFALPDMRGRTVVGVGTNSDVNTIGANDGVAVASRTPKHTHTIPAHDHTIPAHYHSSRATGADINITSSGSHSHAPNFGSYFYVSPPGGAVVGSGSFLSADLVNNSRTAAESHTHTNSAFSGRVGLVTGGSNGDAQMTSGSQALTSNITTVPYIALNYIIKATYSTLLGDSNAEANEAFTVFMGG